MMAVDIAQLGLEVRSDGVVIASKHLRDLTKASKEAETAAQRLARQAETAGKQMQKMGRNLSLYVTTPLLGMTAASVKFGVEFDSTMSKLVTLAGTAREEMFAMRKEVLALAPSVGVGPTELADGLYAIASAGQHGKVALDTLAKAAKASAIGLGDTRTIALTTTAVMQAYAKTNMDASRALDILVGTVEQASVEADQIAPALGRVIGQAAEMGVTFEEVGTFIAVFSRLGVDAAEATTALRGTLATIQNPAEEAIDAFKAMGTSIEGVRASIADRGFIATFQDLVNRSREFGVDLISVVPNVRALSGVLGVFGGTGKVAAEVLDNISNSVGSLEKRFKIMQELDPEFAFKVMKAEAQVLFIELSRDLLPALLELVKKLRELMQAFRDLSPEAQTTVVKVAALTAALGPLLIVLGSILRTLAYLKPAFVLLTKAIVAFSSTIVTTTTAINRFGFGIVALNTQAAIASSRFLAIAGPLGVVVGGLALLIPRLIEGAQRMEDIEDATNLAADAFDRYAKAIRNAKAATDLDDEIGEITGAAQLLEHELIQINEKLEPFLKSADKESNPLFQQLMADKERIEQALDDLGDAYDKLRGRQRGLLSRDVVDPEILKELEEAFTFVDSLGAKLGEAFDVEAFGDLRDELDPLGKEMKDVAAAQALLVKALQAGEKNGGISIATYTKLSRALAMTTTTFQDAMEEALQLNEFDATIKATLEDSNEFVDGLAALEEHIQNIARAIDPTRAQLQDFADLYREISDLFESGAIDEDVFWHLSEAMDRLTSTFRQSTELMLFAFDSLARSAEDGSKAQRTFAIAAEVANAVLAIQAVLAQGGGDPYSAFARMAAMAGIVANLGYSVGQISGSGESKLAADRQASQGTGSVLGDTTAKSESILKAVEITADATSELVGINRGMLHALIALQDGIEGAVVRLARGATDVDMGAAPDDGFVNDIFDLLLPDALGLGFVGDWLSGIFGGDVDLVDEGIKILGGTIDELATEVMVQAFRAFNVKKHIFDDTDLETQFKDLGDEVSTQFALVFGSIRDTVTEAALALGIPLDLIEERIAAFEVATIEISFKDLTADEQREELLAVFSEIFDDLALAVIPFIGQFQKVGEGLGETLVRVATSVQVFQEAINALGLTVSAVDPEVFAQMAVGLVELVGGVENFISMFTTFFDKFASDEQKLAFATSQVTRAFESVGLTIPATRDGMIELMNSLDATTEAGRAQIAMLLQIAPVADEYYSLIEQAEDDRLEQAELVAAQAQRMLEQAQLVADFVGMGPPSQLIQLRERFHEAMDAAKRLGASTREYAMIARSFNLQLQRMAAELRISILRMTQELFGPKETEDLADPLEEVRMVSNRLFEDWQRALESILEFTQSLMLDEKLSPLTPAERLSEAQRQFNQLLSAAKAGDAEAAAALPDAAQALLEEARFMFASGQRYQEIFDATLAALEAIRMPAGIPEFIPDETDGGTGTGEEPPTETDKLISALERFLLATDLAIALRDLSQVLGVSVLTLAAELGVPLRELVVALGVNLDKLTAGTAEALAGVAQLLGADILELLDALGIGLRELAVASGVHLDKMSKDLVGELGRFAETLGIDVLRLASALNLSIADLAKTFGIGIENFEASQFKALIAFSETLGASVDDVTAALGISLGDIADATSLISQAFDIAIAELPDAIQADLGPLLIAVRDATTAADARGAINNLGNYILGLPPDIASALLPFLDLIGFTEQPPDLAALIGIEYNTASTADGVWATAKAVKALGGIKDKYPVTTIPKEPVSKPTAWDASQSFALGGSVTRTGLHQLHAGEFVVTRTADNIIVTPDDSLTRDELAQIRAVLVDIREQSKQYQAADLSTAKGIESAVKQQAEQTRRTANG